MSSAASSVIPDLWPDEVKVTSVVSPIAILKHQAGLLARKTNGLLEAEVASTNVGENFVEHELRLIVPALNRYATTLLSVRHNRERVYPCIVRSPDSYEGAALTIGAAIRATFSDIPKDTELGSPTELIGELSKALSSTTTKSLIFSLLAQINESSE